MKRGVLLALIVAGAAFVGCTADESTESTSTSSPSTLTETTVGAATPTTTESGPDFGDVATAPPGAAGEATGPLGSTELRVETDAGTVQIGSGSVPERLGSAFPLPLDFVVELASETTTDLGFSGTTQLSFDELIELYETGLPEAGYAIEAVDRGGSEFAVFEFSNDDGIGEVGITEAPGSSTRFVIVTFGDGDDAQLEN